MALLLLFLAIALGVSFLCSVLEAVLLSVTPSYVAVGLEKRQRSAKLWQHYKGNVERALAAILSLNTIAHTGGAAGVGAQATKIFGEAYLGIVSAVLTLLILIFSEIIPKTLGTLYWRKLAPLCAQILKLVEWSMYPLVILAQVLTRLMSSGAHHGSVSREEIAALANVGVNEGVLTEEESGVIQSMVGLHKLTARDIMTPRPVIFSLDAKQSVADVLAANESIRFSRIPVYADNADNIIGFVRKDDLLSAAVKGEQASLVSAYKRNVLSVPSNQALLVLLRSMTLADHQMALVVNEYGDVLGLVTMEDLVETMLGLEIVDETDHCPDMQVLARELWQRRANQNVKSN